MPIAPAIRQATTQDVASLVDLRERMLREMGAEDAELLDSLREVSVPWLAEAIADGRAAGWIAEADGRVIGGLTMNFLLVLPQYRAQRGRIAQIYGVYVHPGHRGRGTATRLMQAAVSFAREQDYELATLHAAPRARSIYERLGFEPSGEMRLLL